MATRGAGTPYALKYVKATQEEMRREIIPKCADECAQKRALQALTGPQYRACLKACIVRLVRERRGGS